MDNPVKYAESLSIDDLVKLLKKLSKEYYDGKESVSDEVYDMMLEVLRKKDKKNPFLSVVGSGSKGKIQLPYFMGSLAKIKSDQNSIYKWSQTYPGPYILSDKLDGQSSLLIKQNGEVSLYTRGHEGTHGQDVSHLIEYILGDNRLEEGDAVRGELIMSRKNFIKHYKSESNPRSIVVGLTNSKSLTKKQASLIEFVGYQLLTSEIKLSEQLKIIKELNIKTVNYKCVDEINDKILSDYLVERRNNSEYNNDGVVVFDDSKYHKLSNKKHPPYAFAYKALLKDQMAETTVVNIEWNLSKDKYFKPTVILSPVTILGSEISRATAHNAKYIYDNKIGPGSVVVIVKSGDIIPKIEKVLKSSSKPQMPESDFTWTESGVDIKAVDMCIKQENDVIIKQLSHFFKTLGVKYISEGIITKLVNHNYKSIFDILRADKEDLCMIDGLGETTINKIMDSINDSLSNTEIYILMASSQVFGRGLGVNKIKLITDNIPDLLSGGYKPDNLYDEIMDIKGFDKKTTELFVKNFGEFILYFNKLAKLVDLTYLVDTKGQKKMDSNKFKDTIILFTGFRDKDLKKYIEDNGGKVENSLTKKVNLVVYVCDNRKSSKLLEAESKNIRTIELSEFMKLIEK